MSTAAMLGEAIAHARPGELAALARAALGTGNPAAMAAVIRHLHRLGRDELGLLDGDEPGGGEGAGPKPLRGLDRGLQGAVDLVLRDRDPVTARNVISVIAHTAHPALVAALPALVAGQFADVETADPAAEALREVTVRWIGGDGRRVVPGPVRARLEAAVLEAGRAYREHRCQPVLVALAMLSMRPRPALRAWLDDEDTLVARDLRSVPERVDDPLVRRNLIRWMSSPWLSRPAGRWLHRLDGPDAYAEALADGHLLLDPRRRRALTRADRALQCVPPLSVAVMLPERAQVHVPTLIARLDLSVRSRLPRLADAIALPSPIARWKTLTLLMGHSGARLAETATPFAFDRSPSVARLALHGVLHARPGPTHETLERLEASGHPTVARVAAARRARGDAAGFLARWRRLPAIEARVAALSVLENDRAALLDGFRGQLADDHGTATGTELLVVIALIRRRRLVPEMESTLLAVARGGCVRSASAAVAALADGRSTERLEVLAATIRHADPRMAANAADALARSVGARAIDLIEPLARSEHNRARGSAVRVLLEHDPARGVTELRRMLADPNPLHRVSGIWAARRARARNVGADLRRVAQRDRVAEIRIRADVAVRLLERVGAAPASADGRRRDRRTRALGAVR